MKKSAFVVSVTLLILLLTACSSPSNKRAVSVDELEKVQQEDEKEIKAATATRDALTARELIELAEYTDLGAVQLYMKELSPDFIHASKGEFAAQHRSVVKDTAGKELVMPLSTFYVDINPQASWRAAHTIHRIETGNQLLEEFHQLGFRLVDSGYYLGIKSIQQRYASTQYPGKRLYVTSTYEPWYRKGLYNTKVTWPCFVFEVYKDK
jgi:hypothetical protein